MSNILKAGKYFITDLCYVVPDNQWDEVCDAFDVAEDKNEVIINFKGVYILKTAWGDGEYVITRRGFSCGSFCVDSGTFAVIPEKFILDNQYNANESLGTWVNVDVDCKLTVYVKGHVGFNEYDINTIGDSDYGYDGDDE